MKASLFVAVILFVLGGPDIYAQSFVPLSVEYVSPGESSASDVEVGYTRYGVGIAVPINLKSGRLIPGIRYDRIGYSYGISFQRIASLEHLHHVRMELVWQRPLSAKWQSTFVAAPGWASDFNGKLRQDDFKLSIAALFLRKRSETFSAGFGLTYSMDRSPVVLPLLMLNWQKNNWLAELIAPARAHLWYRKPGLPDVGIAWRGAFIPYNWGFLGGVSGSEAVVRRQLFALGLGLRVPFTNRVSWQMEGGFTVKNQIAIVHDNNTNKVNYNPSMFLWMGFVFNN